MNSEECERLGGMLRSGFTDQKVSTNSVGLGFGLLVSNNLARLIGNPRKTQAITFQSKPREGSVFSFLIAVAGGSAFNGSSGFQSGLVDSSIISIRRQASNLTSNDVDPFNSLQNSPSRLKATHLQNRLQQSSVQQSLPTSSYLLRLSKQPQLKQSQFPPPHSSFSQQFGGFQESFSSGSEIRRTFSQHHHQLQQTPSITNFNIENSHILSSKINEVKCKALHSMTNKTPIMLARTLTDQSSPTNGGIPRYPGSIRQMKPIQSSSSTGGGGGVGGSIKSIPTNNCSTSVIAAAIGIASASASSSVPSDKRSSSVKRSSVMETIKGQITTSKQVIREESLEEEMFGGVIYQQPEEQRHVTKVFPELNFIPRNTSMNQILHSTASILRVPPLIAVSSSNYQSTSRSRRSERNPQEELFSEYEFDENISLDDLTVVRSKQNGLSQARSIQPQNDSASILPTRFGSALASVTTPTAVVVSELGISKHTNTKLDFIDESMFDLAKQSALDSPQTLINQAITQRWRNKGGSSNSMHHCFEQLAIFTGDSNALLQESSIEEMGGISSHCYSNGDTSPGVNDFVRNNRQERLTFPRSRQSSSNVTEQNHKQQQHQQQQQQQRYRAKSQGRTTMMHQGTFEHSLSPMSNYRLPSNNTVTASANENASFNANTSLMSASMNNIDEGREEGSCEKIKSFQKCRLERLRNEQNSRRILIVDDEIFNIYSVKLILRSLGLSEEICEAHNGEQAINVLLEQQAMKSRRNQERGYQVALIIMDVNMPIMNGIDCTRRIREMSATNELSYSPKIVGYTAFADLDTKNSCLDAGMDDLFTKPSRKGNFIRILESYYMI